MKIFNFGLPKTGTSSFHRFLIKNKIKSIHTNDGFIKYVYPGEYYKFKKNEKSILDYIISTYDAFGDLPWYSLSAEIVNKYKKEAFFFATARQPKLWAKSILKIHHHMFKYKEIAEYHNEVFCGLITENSIANEKKLIKYYNEHNEKIMELSKKHNVEIQFLRLENIEEDIKILKNKIDIIDYSYPPRNTYRFLL